MTRTTAGSGIQESDTTPTATVLLTPNSVRTAKNISAAKYTRQSQSSSGEPNSGTTPANTASGRNAAAQAMAVHVSSGA